MPRTSRSVLRSPPPAAHKRQGKEQSSSRAAGPERSDVLVSVVVSTYLLTHLNHVLQRAEYGAAKDGRASLAANYAQLRKLLCMDVRSMEDASASGAADHDPPCAA